MDIDTSPPTKPTPSSTPKRKQPSSQTEAKPKSKSPSASKTKTKSKKRPRLSSQPPSHTSHHSGTTTTTATTIRRLPWTYIHLTLLPSNPTAVSVSKAPPIDAILARTCLTSALSQFLGLTGTAINIDILKVQGRDVWVRVGREDAGAVVEAVRGWIGNGNGNGNGIGGGGRSGEGDSAVAWRVRGRSEWLGGLVAGDGRELFEGD